MSPGNGAASLTGIPPPRPKGLVGLPRPRGVPFRRDNPRLSKRRANQAVTDLSRAKSNPSPSPCARTSQCTAKTRRALPRPIPSRATRDHGPHGPLPAPPLLPRGIATGDQNGEPAVVRECLLLGESLWGGVGCTGSERGATRPLPRTPPADHVHLPRADAFRRRRPPPVPRDPGIQAGPPRRGRVTWHGRCTRDPLGHSSRLVSHRKPLAPYPRGGHLRPGRVEGKSRETTVCEAPVHRLLSREWHHPHRGSDTQPVASSSAWSGVLLWADFVDRGGVSVPGRDPHPVLALPTTLPAPSGKL